MGPLVPRLPGLVGCPYLTNSEQIALGFGHGAETVAVIKAPPLFLLSMSTFWPLWASVSPTHRNCPHNL